MWANINLVVNILSLCFPGGSDGKESACNARDLGSTPGLRRSLGERNNHPFQYSGLGMSMDWEAWWAWGPWCCKESDLTQWLSLIFNLPPFWYCLVWEFVNMATEIMKVTINPLENSHELVILLFCLLSLSTWLKLQFKIAL